MLIRLSDSARLFHADCRDAIRSLPDNSIDSVVTDPPYALVSIVKRFGGANAAPAKGNDAYMRASAGFMNQRWDTGETAFSTEFWAEVLRVLKPGGHVAAFGASRGYHRMACAIEDAGFEIRDSIINVIDPESPVINFMQSLNDEQLGAFLRCLDDAEFGGTLAWMYGTGFPKSQNVAKFIDKELGAKGTLGGPRSAAHATMLEAGVARRGEKHEGWDRPWMDDPEAIAAAQSTYIPASNEAQRFNGFGTALKPAFEPIVLARKPLGTGDVDVRRNVEKELRKCGITSEIVWVEESAETANCLKKNTNSPRERQASFVENAIANEITNTALETSTKPENPVVDGTQITVRNTSTIRSDGTASYANKSSSTTDANAPAVENANRISSLLTTSTEAERNTENLSDKRSTQTSANVVSPLDSEHFAGIATGLTDSMEHVHIKRKGGSFVWPKELPTFVPSRPLTVAANALRWGTGALNIDGCRVEAGAADVAEMEGRSGKSTPNKIYGANINGGGVAEGTWKPRSDGRWPANICHDGSDEVVGAFPNTGPAKRGNRGLDTSIQGGNFAAGKKAAWVDKISRHDDNGGSAARFFYSAKASKADRAGSKHPTVKPIALMEWLATLITPPGGTILDPFAGSGTTGAAAARKGFSVILCEREAEYVEDIKRRLSAPLADPLPGVAAPVRLSGLTRLIRWNAAVASYHSRSQVAA